jgi:antitoxin ParD1/3/4
MNRKTDAVPDRTRLLEEQQARRKALRAALIEGERSGVSTPFTFDEFIERKRRERDFYAN